MYREITIKEVVCHLVKAADELFAFGTSIESARNLARIGINVKSSRPAQRSSASTPRGPANDSTTSMDQERNICSTNTNAAAGAVKR
jgi:hypothetical protein